MKRKKNDYPFQVPSLATMLQGGRESQAKNQKSKKLILAMEPNGKSSLNLHQLKLGPKRTTIYLDLNPY